MFNWSALTLLLYIWARMSGFVLFNPIFARSGVPTLFRAGLIGMLSLTVYTAYEAVVPVPDTLVEFAVRVLAEVATGAIVGFVVRFFLFIPEQSGEMVDTQMGMAMARSYDPGTQVNMTMTANLLSRMMLVLFFVENGHVTLLRLMLTSGEIVPFGAAAPGAHAADHAVVLFAECVLLSVKLSFPILGAELLSQVGMGVLMKAIPQINVFAINIEVKVFVGLVMLALLMAPISRFLLEAEVTLLREIPEILSMSAG